jgi:hypothetical protein
MRTRRFESRAHRVRIAAVTSGPKQCQRCGAATIQEDLDARIAAGSGLTERLRAALAQRREHAFDMLAGSKAIGAVIDTAAGIAEGVKVSDFHLIEAAASQLHAHAIGRALRILGAINAIL